MFPAVDEPDDTLSTGNFAGPLVNISWMGVTIARWPGWSWCFFSRKRGAPSNVGLTHFRALDFGSPFDGSNSHQSDRQTHGKIDARVFGRGPGQTSFWFVRFLDGNCMLVLVHLPKKG